VQAKGNFILRNKQSSFDNSSPLDAPGAYECFQALNNSIWALLVWNLEYKVKIVQHNLLNSCDVIKFCVEKPEEEPGNTDFVGRFVITLSL
jgi:hypothetical protein